jgi:NAD(P)-dependent dehydrogenase (short-subunit alcohol dehydrogenase family)
MGLRHPADAGALRQAERADQQRRHLPGHDVEDNTLEEWNRILSVNATGVYLGMKHAIAAMKQSGEPCSIVNRSSID